MELGHFLVSDFPFLTHAVSIHHTLEAYPSVRLMFLTDLVVSWVDVKTMPSSKDVISLDKAEADSVEVLLCNS